ncbi:MAG: universal stress protein [Actinobacteria bacterium]|nr:MAG: universal stress protein [Actinomycetota bacterium]
MSPTIGNGSSASANSSPETNPLPLQPDELVASRVSHANHPATSRLTRSMTKIAHAVVRLFNATPRATERHPFLLAPPAPWNGCLHPGERPERGSDLLVRAREPHPRSGAGTTHVSAWSPVRIPGHDGLAFSLQTNGEEATVMTTILVGTDSSAAADLAVDHAARLARDRESDLVVLLVRSDGDLRSVVDPGKAADPGRYLAHVAQRFPGVPTSTRVEHGEAAERIVAVAQELSADTIVVGNRGTHGSWWRVRDSVPNLVLRHSPCSVFIVDTRRAQ